MSSPTEKPTTTDAATTAPISPRTANNSKGMVLSPWRLGSGSFAEHQCMIMSTSLSLNPDYAQLSKIYCWGQNKFEQLGGVNLEEGGDLSDFDAVDLGDRPGFPVQVAVGEKHTCVLMSTHQVMCWGSNKARALGTETIFGSVTEMGNALIPLDLDPFLDEITFEARIPIQISAGVDHTCVLFSNGSIRCWGSNEHGQLGFDSKEISTSLKYSRDVVFPDGVRADKISLGKYSTCASVTTSDNPGLYCWGSSGLVLDESWKASKIDMQNLKVTQIDHISSTASYHYVALITETGATLIKQVLLDERMLETKFGRLDLLNQIITQSSSILPALITTGKGLVCRTYYEADVVKWNIACLSDVTSNDKTGLLEVDSGGFPKSITLLGGVPLNLVGTKDNVYLISANTQTYAGSYRAAGSNAEGQLGIRNGILDTSSTVTKTAPWEFNFPIDGIFEAEARNNSLISQNVQEFEPPATNYSSILSFVGTFGALFVVLCLTEFMHRISMKVRGGGPNVDEKTNVGQHDTLDKRRSSWIRNARTLSRRSSDTERQQVVNPRWMPIEIE